MADYGLLIAFTNESSDFCDGFQAGEIWAALNAGAPEIEFECCRVANRVVIERMALQKGYEVEWIDTAEGWATLKLTLNSKPPANPNPYGLKVVK